MSNLVGAVSTVLVLGPTWARAVLRAVSIGLLWGVLSAAQGQGAGPAAVVGLGAAVVYALLDRLFDRPRDGLPVALGSLDDVQRRAAVRGAVGGPVPADPDVREAAALLVEGRLARLEGNRVLAVVVSVVVVLGLTAAAVVRHSPWWTLLAVATGALLVRAVVGAPLLRRRLDRLTA
ncbi:hypothetical protein [Rhodococcus aerolatus]